MVWQDGIRVLIVGGLVLLLVTPTLGQRRKQRIPGGQWGGQHIRMDVGANSATIEYDCANGSITGPLSLDSKGRFTWRGTHMTEHGGPVRSDETANQHPATYTGWIKDDTMTLTVKLPDKNQTIGTFSLTHGRAGRVFKCM
jgi:hypothetical protein